MTIDLVEPTDFIILESFSDCERDGAVNTAKRLDMDRSYVNSRLAHLADRELLKRIGPAHNSGIYRITPLGIAATRHRDLYQTDPEQFEATIHDVADDITITRPEVVTEP